MDTSRYKSLFLQEAKERLASIEQSLLSLETNPSDASSVESLFRSYHSIKGMCASMGYESIQGFAHAQEDLLDAVRSGKFQVSDALLSLLFRSVDAMKSLVSSIERDMPLDTHTSTYLTEKIRQFALTGAQTEQKASPKEKKQFIPDSTVSDSGISIADTIKVERRVFDEQLMIAGSLLTVLTRLKGLTSHSRDIELKNSVHKLEEHIEELHQNILDARMIPFETVTQNLPRVVRDISKKVGKEAELSMEGAQITIDRSVLEAIGDPLLHIIRNSVDHGLETPAERETAGKPPKGRLAIRATARRDRITITVTDDGKGMDIQGIREKALLSLPEERVNAMSDKELLMLVCIPGFSLAKRITDVSGRGVGMDLVKNVIEKLGGNLDIDSVPGQGTTIHIELPRASSIMKVMVMKVGGEMFSVPLSKVERVIEIGPAEIEKKSITFMDREIPAIMLSEKLGMETANGNKPHKAAIIESGIESSQLAALIVDGFEEEIDAYVRPLKPPFTSVWCVAGITILGDGRPLFLLDLPHLIRG